MPTINESFTDKEFERLKDAKGALSWHDFIVSTVGDKDKKLELLLEGGSLQNRLLDYEMLIADNIGVIEGKKAVNEALRRMIERIEIAQKVLVQKALKESARKCDDVA